MNTPTKTPAAFLLAACIALPMQATAETAPLAGKWERTLTAHMFMHSTNTYAPWEQPMSSACYSHAALKGLGILSAADSKALNEKDGASCQVSEERQSAASASWRLLCTKPDGVVEDTRATVVGSEASVRSSSVLRVIGKGDALGPDGMRIELVMRRTGDCDDKAQANK